MTEFTRLLQRAESAQTAAAGLSKAAKGTSQYEARRVLLQDVDNVVLEILRDHISMVELSIEARKGGKWQVLQLSYNTTILKIPWPLLGEIIQQKVRSKMTNIELLQEIVDLNRKSLEDLIVWTYPLGSVHAKPTDRNFIDPQEADKLLQAGLIRGSVWQERIYLIVTKEGYELLGKVRQEEYAKRREIPEGGREPSSRDLKLSFFRLREPLPAWKPGIQYFDSFHGRGQNYLPKDTLVLVWSSSEGKALIACPAASIFEAKGLWVGPNWHSQKFVSAEQVLVRFGYIPIGETAVRSEFKVAWMEAQKHFHYVWDYDISLEALGHTRSRKSIRDEVATNVAAVDYEAEWHKFMGHIGGNS